MNQGNPKLAAIDKPISQGNPSGVTKVKRYHAIDEIRAMDATWIDFGDLNPGEVTQLCQHRRALLAEREKLLAALEKRDALIEELRHDFVNVSVGGCNCGTKPPDPMLHELNCHYRMAEAGLSRIATLISEASK